MPRSLCTRTPRAENAVSISPLGLEGREGGRDEGGQEKKKRNGSIKGKESKREETTGGAATLSVRSQHV